jgi:hypothetical protein
MVTLDSDCLAVYRDDLVVAWLVFWARCYPQTVFVGVCLFARHRCNLIIVLNGVYWTWEGLNSSFKGRSEVVTPTNVITRIKYSAKPSA